MSAEPLGRTGLLVDLSAALAAREAGPLRAALEAARDGGVDPTAVEEVLLQSYLFLGYPAALNAFASWRALTGRPAPGALPDDWEGWQERGEDVCRRVYAGQFDGLRANVSELHPDLARWMIVEGYGKVLGRPGLELRERELCIAGLLAVLDAPRQLHSHLRGSLHVGATTAEVDAALARALRFAAPEVAERAHATWRHVQARWESAARAHPEGETG